MSLTQYNLNTSSMPAAIPAVTAILGAGGPVGAIVSGAISVLSSLGLSIKGKTQHLAQSQVEGPARDFSSKMYDVFLSAFNAQQILAIQAKVPARFSQAIQDRWGFSQSLNEVIYTDINSNYLRKDELSRQFGLFYIWVGTNVDAESANEFSIVLDAYFASIFLQAVADAGLSAERLKGKVAVPSPADGMDPIDPNGGSSTVPTKAGSSSLLALLALAGAGWYMLKKGA